MLPEKTREQFEKVIESQLARIQAMKDQGDFIDYSNLFSDCFFNINF